MTAFKPASPVKTLEEVLSIDEIFEIAAKHLESLPDELKSALQAHANGDIIVWDVHYLMRLGVSPSEVEVFVDGTRLDRVTHLLPMTREVELYDGSRIKADSAEIRNTKTGNVIRSW